ncbi:MAG: exodeoxyribonuclease V subunit gamma [Ignavibacterium sp.]|nr:exodeoxyribonuclease V subunit gamma [Ignavibacterium sp.]
MILSKTKIDGIDPDLLLDEYIQQKKLNQVLIIVPTNRKIRYLKRELITASPNKAVSRMHLYTLSTYTSKLFFENDLKRNKILGEASGAVLLNRAFAETDLKYFSSYIDGIPRGTLDRIKNVINKYKLNGVIPEQLIQESLKLTGSEKLKAVDIANVYSKYLELCVSLNVYEDGDVYSGLLKFDSNKFAERFRTCFPEVNLVMVNGFDEFTIPEIEIINYTTKIKDLKLYVLFDYYNYNPSLFSHLDECYKNFSARGFFEIKDTSQTGFTFFRQGLREKLFTLNDTNQNIKSEVEVIKITGQTPEDEITLIAKEIKSLILNHKADVGSIAVAFNLISDHSDLIRDVFTRYGIPFNLTDRFSLSESQPVIALINLLEISENNFYYKNIFRALTGRWIKNGEIDVSNLLRVSSNLKIISGYNNWIDMIDRALEEIKLSEEDDENNFLPAGFYTKAKKDIEKIYELVKTFRDKKTISEFKSDFKQLVFDLGIPERLVNDHPGSVEKNVKAVTTLLQTSDELFGLLSQELGDSKKYPLGFFISQLKTALQFTRYNVKERHSSGVLVTSVNELRGLYFDNVFIGGMVDGEFPTRYQPEIFFSGSYRKDEYKHILEERYHFYQTLSSAKKKIYLSYAKNSERKEFTPSSFLNDFTRIINSVEKNTLNYESLIYSKMELLLKAQTLLKEGKENVLSDSGINVERLKQSIEIDKIRNDDPFGESEYTGFIGGSLTEEEKKKLLEQKEKQFSASQLEEYAKCPFQYFLKRILSLETIEEPSEEIEAFELGSLIHSILFEFYRTIKEKNILLKNCNDKTFRIAEKIIFDIAAKKVDRLNLQSTPAFFEREKIFGAAGNKQNSILYRFLETEQKNEGSYIPEYFETAFGSFNKSVSEFEVSVNGVKLRGKIDRIDLDKDNEKYKVIDYKLSGKKPVKSDLGSGVSLQLPIYLYASKILIQAQLNKEFLPAEAVIYSLKLKNEEFGEKIIDISNKRNPDENDLIESNKELIRICNEVIPLYVDKISKGMFNLSTLESRENKVCKYCDFRSICRIQEVN